MTWIITATGREQNLAVPGEVPIEEIAHALAQVNRFGGHCCRPYSVAEHSLLVANIMEHDFQGSPSLVLAALMHDAHEAMVGDMVSPAKCIVGGGWARYEAGWEIAIREQFGLEGDHALIKRCDLIALATERRDLLPVNSLHTPWPVLQGVEPLTRVVLSRQDKSWREMHHVFLDRFYELLRRALS